MTIPMSERRTKVYFRMTERMGVVWLDHTIAYSEVKHFSLRTEVGLIRPTSQSPTVESTPGRQILYITHASE